MELRCHRNSYRINRHAMGKWIAERIRCLLEKSASSRHPDHAAADYDNIILSTDLLSVSEFRFFQISYKQWYGRELEDIYMERYFDAYMMENHVPHWVRHTARQVIARYAAGTLDPQAFDSTAPVPEPEPTSPIPVNTILMPLIYIIIFGIASGILIIG